MVDVQDPLLHQPRHPASFLPSQTPNSTPNLHTHPDPPCPRLIPPQTKRSVAADYRAAAAGR